MPLQFTKYKKETAEAQRQDYQMSLRKSRPKCTQANPLFVKIDKQLLPLKIVVQQF
jgi:hypothetical protein